MAEPMTVDGKKYVSSGEAAGILETSLNPIRKFYSNGTLRGFQETPRSIIYVLLGDVLKLKKKWDAIRDTCYTYEEAGALLYYGKGTFSRWQREGKCTAIKILNVAYIPKEEIDRYLSGLKDLNQNYYSLKEFSSLRGVCKGSALLILGGLITAGMITDYKKEHGAFYYSRKEVDSYIESIKEQMFFAKEGYITCAEAVKIYSKSYGAIRYWAEKLPSTIKTLSGLLINVNDLENAFKKSKDDKKFYRYEVTTNPDAAYRHFIRITEEAANACQYPETVNLYREFLKSELKVTKCSNLRELINKFSRTFKFFAKLIGKEIYEYTDAEIQLFLTNAEITDTAKLEIARFLAYCNSVPELRCNFSNHYRRTYKPRDYSAAKETYPKNIFMQFGIYVSDIKKHTTESLKSPRHCQLWIYILFHMFEAWRNGDIIDIPNVQLEQIGVTDLNYFTANRLTFTQAQVIINQYYRQEFVQRKIGALNCLNVPEVLIEAFGSALVIAEIHRRNNNERKLMYCFLADCPSPRDWKRFFREKKELAVFRNLKACRTLMTLFYEWAQQRPNMDRENHIMLRRLRMHTLQAGKGLTVAETDTVYVQNLEDESKEENFSKAMFDRGIFGWLYYLMLKAYMEPDNFKHLSFNDTTNLIVAMQDKQSPLQMEGLGKFLLQQQQKKKLLVEELRAMPHEQLWEKIKAIHSGLMPSRIPESQCFRYGNCPYPRPQEHICRQCQYLIPNKYFLISLSDGIYRAYDKLIGLYKEEEDKKVNLGTDIAKARSILIDYIYLLEEACNGEYGLGEEVVNAFINISEMQKNNKIIKELHGKRASAGGLL